ncbi:hypothetical protein O3M35_011842 [Rhynocoris fuscipes]|uniref:Alpha-1,3/1,6-mannosyltransferase ALG2 n=1 Tax=Rhynocoris fuscipes TaxID=488301 RepID=A0AAW1CZ02_9HEMI
MTKKIIFLHPDLGVGGAERLVIDAATALEVKDYDVSFITSHYDSKHCFEETKNGAFKITVVGDWIPRSIFGRFYALLAYLKMLYCALYIVLFEKPDLVFCDLVSVCIPILHLSVKNVIFYCHYPDQLLSRREGILKSIYRYPLNWLEEKTTNCADKIYVNSEFTKEVYMRTFRTLSREPQVLYPSINTSSFDLVADSNEETILNVDKDKLVFLSINRYERKKHIELSINALKHLKETLPSDKFDQIVLVIAGGYDPRVKENIEYHSELGKLAESHGLQDRIHFFRSPSDVDKVKLLRRCNCLIYTPPNEHFGIVPLEAMYSKKPVIACNSGGPKETIVNAETGLLCDFTVESFANAMLKIVNDRELAGKMGEQGFSRFIEKFSYSAFSYQLYNDIESLLEHSDINTD